MSALSILALVQAVALSGRIQTGVVVRPDTVHVGDPFTVSVRVRAPGNATIEFAAAPDSSFAIEPLDPVQLSTRGDSAAIDQTAQYRLAAWRVGTFSIRFPDALVRQDIGVRRVPVVPAVIVVASVLPADTAQWIPKPARTVFTFGLPWWVWLLLFLAAAAIALLLWWLWRRRRQRPSEQEAPIVVAEREFARIEALGLVAAGETARHADLMVEVLRDYLAAVVAGASTAQTSLELSGALRRNGVGPHVRCAALLAEVDLVKFAGRSIDAERATVLGKEARSVAQAMQAALDAPALARAA